MRCSLDELDGDSFHSAADQPLGSVAVSDNSPGHVTPSHAAPAGLTPVAAPVSTPADEHKGTKMFVECLHVFYGNISPFHTIVRQTERNVSTYGTKISVNR